MPPGVNGLDMPENLWTPARVAEEASRKYNRAITNQTVRTAIERGELHAIRLDGPTDGTRVSGWAVREDDARSWVPRAIGRPAKT